MLLNFHGFFVYLTSWNEKKKNTMPLIVSFSISQEVFIFPWVDS